MKQRAIAFNSSENASLTKWKATFLFLDRQDDLGANGNQ